MHTLWGEPLDWSTLRDAVGSLEQLVGADMFSFADGPRRGVRMVRLRTGAADIDVVIDRAMDIYQVHVRGVPFGWVSQAGLAGPWYVDDHEYGPLKTFHGGLLTTCGLDHAFRPATRDVRQFAYAAVTQENKPMHGRVAALPATLNAYGIDWERPAPVVFVEGTIVQARAFGEHLVLHRRIEAQLGASSLTITDRLVNAGYAPTEHRIAYHINVGWPVVVDGSRITTDASSSQMQAGGDPDWSSFRTAAESVAEKVWQHDGYPADATAHVEVSSQVQGRRIGFRIDWSPSTLPHLLEWQVNGPRQRVLGFEPTNVDLAGSRPVTILEPDQKIVHALALHFDVS